MGRHLEVDGKGSAGDGEGSWLQVPVVEGCDAVRRLGAGVSGTVWLVQPRDGSAPLAAKCFAPDPARQAAGEAGEILRHNESEITQEWRILAQNDHEHLLRAHRVVPLGGSWAGGSALLMDYAAGGSVRDIVAARGPLSVGECVTVLTPLGQVLSFLHGAGIRHGDVSPGNVLLTAQGKPVLADLGLGRLVGQGHGSGGGTPGFFCPQDPGVSAGSDVYSMAAVGWFALTGQAPPATRDRMPLAMYARDVPPELAAALEAGLSENVAQRPTAAAFAQAVFRSARAEPVALAHTVHPSDLPELLTRRAARQPRGPAFLRLRRGSPRERRGTGRWPRFEARFGFGLVAGSGHPFGRMPLRRLARVRGLGWRLLAAWVAGAVAAACLAAWLVLPGAGPRAGSGFPLADPITVPGGTVTALDETRPSASPAPATRPAATQPVATRPAAAQATAKPPGPSPDAAAALGPSTAMLPAGVREQLVSADPATALAALAWVRSYALTSGEFPLLETVNAVGSPARRADAATVSALQQAKHSFTGMETTVTSASVASRKLLPGGSDAPTQTAVVSATVTIGPYAEHDAAGGVIHRQESKAAQKLDIVLVLVSGRWFVQQILPTR